ncbi:MAG TPA: hypothetical protein VEY67_12060, partial [Candidatus Dormibacteraeota bacterium]|nr:hypothetical protein [Candidatus Dormibacteraeota bacterium]
EPHLRALLGIDESTAGDRSEQFGAWRGVVEAIARRGTTALVFEDLQWADDGLLDFIDSLFEWSRTSPVLVVTLTRPELLERRPTLGSASRSAVALHLDPLTPGEMRELLGGLAPELDGQTLEAVVERAEGIPLYAIELVRMLRDEAARPDGTTGGPTRLAIPPSLQALVAARLDALEPADRALLQDASVLGQTFTIPGLAAVSGTDPAGLEPRLRALVRREFLTVEADPRSPERGQYGFVQAVVHEVAYGTLARRDRRARHLAAARYVDSLDDESMATVVATHYVEAYRASPDDEQARTIRAQARVALRAAADRSARLHNYAQAARDIERALELTDEPDERAALLIQQAELNEAGGRLDEAATTAERARDAYAALGDEPKALHAVALLGRIELKRGHTAEAAALFERSLARLDRDADPALFARFAAEYGRVHMLRDRNAEAAEWTERALAAAGPLRLVEVIAEAMNTRGVCLQGLGRYDEGVSLIRAAVEMAATHHLSNAELRARFNLGGRVFADDPPQAISILTAGVDIATRTGRRDWLGALLHFAAGMLMTGPIEPDAALELLGRIPDDERAPSELAAVRVDRAEIAAYRGERGVFERELEAARQLTADESNDQQLWDWAVTSVSVALAEGRLDDVRRGAQGIGGNWAEWSPIYLAHAALRERDLPAARAAATDPVLRAGLGRLFDVERLLLDGAVAALDGRREEGLAQLRAGMQLARDLSGKGLLVNGILDAIAVLGPGDPETPALAAEARSILEPIGFRAHLDRLDELLSRPTAGAPAAPGRRVQSEGVRA